MAERRGASQLARTMRSMIVIALIGGSLAAFNTVSTRRDVGLATANTSNEQRDFFAQSALRPDLELFYKALSSPQRVKMARQLGEYNDGRMAKVIGILLGTFDPDARTALSQSLDRLAKTQPDDVSAQLSLTGSFQFLAVSHALRSVGKDAIPKVAERLSDATTRENALTFLVDSGEAAVPSLEAKLDSSDKDVRLAAADALGKLAAKSSVPKLASLYGKATEAEKLAYLSAISSIGDPSSEGILTAALRDDSLTIPQRSQAGLGLGRIGSASAVATLAPFTDNPDRQFQESIYSALSLAGATALTSQELSIETRTRVAVGIQGEQADQFLASAIKTPELRPLAIRGLGNRPSLVGELVKLVVQSDDGEFTDSLLAALATTEAGKKELQTLVSNSKLGGLAQRRLRLAGA